MRSIKELLHLMLDNQQCFKTLLDNQQCFVTYGHSLSLGLCTWIAKMYRTSLITEAERSVLGSYIRNNPPFIYKIYRRHGRYYWKPGDIKPRIAWIKKHIEKNQ